MSNAQNIAKTMRDIDLAMQKSIMDLEIPIKEVVKEQINEVVNDAYTPKVYQRKHYLENSLQGDTIPISGGSVILIDHNDALMHYESVDEDTPITDQQSIPSWIENGQIFPKWGGGFAYLQPRPYMEKSRIFLEGVIQRMFGRSLDRYL